MERMRELSGGGQRGLNFPGFGGGFSGARVDMPPPQYLGAKYKLLPWIMQFADGEGAVLDGFGGSQSVAFAMKKAGRAVYTCDFLSFCHNAGLALVENRGETLSAEDAEMLFAENPKRGAVMRNFKGVFFSESECVMLDNFRANVEKLEKYKRALALATMCRALTRKTIMGHFAHMQALNYANNPARVRRNPSIARPLRGLFMQLLPEYNAAVFDNGHACESFRADVLEVLPELSGRAELAYYDPPYCGSHSDYQAFYHLLETFAENWADKKFINGNRRYYPPRRSGFDKKSDAENSFRRLFELSDEIPKWLISYNDRSYPSPETLAKMAARHKKVRTEEKPYEKSYGGKGSVAGSKEFLLVCE